MEETELIEAGHRGGEVVITESQTELIRKTIAKDATTEELNLFFYDCKRRGVHPLDKLIHFTKRGGKYVPITSIDFIRSRASETGECAGIDDASFMGSPSDGKSFQASIAVYRHVNGEKCAFVATARWDEYYPGEKSGKMWKKMPYTMLGKCAEALALRKAFPQQIAGLYSSEEMDQADSSTGQRKRPATTMTEPREKSQYMGNSQSQERDERPISEGQQRLIRARITRSSVDDKHIRDLVNVEHLADIKRFMMNDVLEEISKMTDEQPEGEPGSEG